jgi:hypothetical protein
VNLKTTYPRSLKVQRGEGIFKTESIRLIQSTTIELDRTPLDTFSKDR